MHEDEVEQLVRQVVLVRGFDVKIHHWAGEVSVTITDPDDPRGEGCCWLRGESGGRDLRAALKDACEQAIDDRYPQATACGRAIGHRRPDGRYDTCKLGKIHDGECRA